jgi:hypothetical protein
MLHILPMVFVPISSIYGALSPMITNGLLNYHQDGILPARIQIIILSLVKHGWLENALDTLFRCVTWTAIILVLSIM